MMLTKLRTVFQFQQLIIYKLVQFLQLVYFLSCCSLHVVCFCQKWQFLQFLYLIGKIISWSRQSLSISLQYPAFHFQLTYFITQSYPLLTCNNLRPVLFLVFQLSRVFVPSTSTVQQQLFVTNVDMVNTATWLNVLTNYSLSSKCRSRHWVTKINLKCTRFGSGVFTAKFCRNVLTSYWNLRTFKALHCFKGLSRSWKNGQFFQGLSRPCGHLDHSDQAASHMDFC